MAGDIFRRDYVVVWDHDLSLLVSDHHGRPWSMLRTGEYSQNSYVEIDVDADRPDGYLGDEAQAELDAWLAMPVPASDAPWRERSAYDSAGPSVDVMLWDLCRCKVIEPGKYLIKVWW